MNARDAATVACRVLAAYILFESLNVHTRVFFIYNANSNLQPQYYPLLLIPVFLLIAIYLWREGGNRISKSLAKPDDEINSTLNAQQWVCLFLSLMGIYFLISSITQISSIVFQFASQFGTSSQFMSSNQWQIGELLSFSGGLFQPFYGLILLICAWPLSKGLIYIQSFKSPNQKSSAALTTQSLALSLLGIWLLVKLLPQVAQYSSFIFMSPQPNQSAFTILSLGAWVQLCFAIALIVGARGIVGMLYALRVWGNPFAKEEANQ